MKRHFVLGLLLLLPAISSAATLEDLLAEKGVITKAEAKDAAASSGTKVYWNKGTKIEFPDNGFTTQINTLIQTRATFTDNDNKPNKFSFDVTKARIIVAGTALNKEFSYKLNGDFVGTTSSGEKSPDLRDAFIAWKTCDMTELKLGQYKTLSSRQFNTEDESLQFPDRSIASDFFDSGRQDGLNGTLSLMDGNLKINAGVFNGSSDGEGINRPGLDTKQTGVLNVRWIAMGKINPYVEGDVENSQELGLTMGASYVHSSANKSFVEALGAEPTIVSPDVDKDTISVDAMLKYQGMSFAAEYYHADTQVDEFNGSDSQPNGFYAQAGYFLVPEKWELAARYSLVDCDNGAAGGKCAGNDSIDGVDVSLNHYWMGNSLKGSIAYALQSEEPVDSSDNINTSRWIVFMSAAL